MLKRIALVTLLAALYAAPSAAALGPVGTAIHRAESYWSVTPCGGQIQITHGVIPGAVAEAGDCAIELDSRWFPNAASEIQQWPYFCAVMTHEIGHLALGPAFFAAADPLDPAHSANPLSIMWGAGRIRVVPAACLSTRFRSDGSDYHDFELAGKVAISRWSARSHERLDLETDETPIVPNGSY